MMVCPLDERTSVPAADRSDYEIEFGDGDVQGHRFDDLAFADDHRPQSSSVSRFAAGAEPSLAELAAEGGGFVSRLLARAQHPRM
jgi:hypothetical protein